MAPTVGDLRGDAESPAPPRESLRLQLLGPLRIWRGDVELSAGPRQQAYLLALLLAQPGRTLGVGELIDMLWEDDAPVTALNVIQKHVGALRRLFEPTLPARGSGSYLRRDGDGYAFVADGVRLDVVTFHALVEAAETAVAEQRPEDALRHYVAATALWHGPAGDGFAHPPAAMPVFSALDDEFLAACVTAAEIAITLGTPESVLPCLRVAAAIGPLNEPVHASLVSALGAAGHRVQALAAFQAVRTRLTGELGVEPGPRLRAAHLRTLEQPVPRTPTRRAPSPEPEAGQPAPPPEMVGRAEELSALRRAADAVVDHGSVVALVEGEPGIGKTRLLEHAAAEARGRGLRVVWGHSLEGSGAPPLWPWARVVDGLLGGPTTTAGERRLTGELGPLLNPNASDEPARPPRGARFRLFEQVVAVVAHASAERPLLIVLDDLHWADDTSLQLFAHLAGVLPRGVLLVGALRDRAPVPAPGEELARMLAAVSRLPDHRRIPLGPLSTAEVAELFRRETGQNPTAGIVRSLSSRTAGNPFFVRELSLLLAEDGVVTEAATERAGVPSTVRDVVRDRMSGLSDQTRTLLEIAAFVGRDVDLRVLAAASGVDTLQCLDRLEPVRGLGLLEPKPGDPFTARFAHDLIRDSLVEAVPAHLARRLHLRIADAVAPGEPGGEFAAERLAHHLLAAGSLADPARTTGALLRAGRNATAAGALEAAEQQLRSAVRVARAADLTQLELVALTQLNAAHGMRSGYVSADLDLLERAETLAWTLGREVEAAGFLLTRWTAHLQVLDFTHATPLARRLLDRGDASPEPSVRAIGWFAWGIHQWHLGEAGEGYRFLSRCAHGLPRGDAGPAGDPLRLAVQVPVWLAQVTAAHGDVEGARELFDAVEEEMGDDPYVVAVWSAFSALTAVQANDPAWALRAAERGLVTDSDLVFPTLRTHQRLARHWAHAATGRDPARAAAEAEELILTTLADPPLRSVAGWYGALTEMWLAAGDLARAAAALDRAEHFLRIGGQRDAEGHLLLVRARLLRAEGEPAAVVRAATERARALCVAREAHLFARRADELK
ncbi:ATP-binding protein [Cryptosporangium arvum]|uniref:Putative transcriptional regulator n=1 Tax=Cryptosporangium arvum DSM 44712 TaxID=927661 RepID=A0A010ZUD0_9ACTN|nr:BTAD domain-containing putative transcriptional regulator [Cryptosporangium arvum]EXG82269.1 putative transcriptional regulator [Cryptosporangium arvum DSM 44712]